MLGGIIREIEEMEYPKDEIIRGLVNERIRGICGTATYSFAVVQEKIVEIIRRHMEDDGWIPCEEGLPGAWDIDPDLEREDIIWPEYNVTIKGSSEATTLYYDFQDDTWFDDNGNIYEVVAWRDLPDALPPKAVSQAENRGRGLHAADYGEVPEGGVITRKDGNTLWRIL